MSSKRASEMQIDVLPETPVRPVLSQLIRKPSAREDSQSTERSSDQVTAQEDAAPISPSTDQPTARRRTRTPHVWPAPPSDRLVGGVYIKPAKSATSVFGAYLFRAQKEALAECQRRYGRERNEEIDRSEIVRRALDYYFSYLAETPINDWQPGEGR